MDTTKAGSIAQGNTQSDYKTWRKSDTVWMLGLYGTAIGALAFCFYLSMPGLVA
ncbi:serine transporter [Proteus mirabilis]|uniref:Serine transporter n=1 Tax=Proteus mirabilis TaxID=584 RepID=A0A2X2BI64_PROMI|nr:serine transporter [Proteus mirabilis]